MELQSWARELKYRTQLRFEAQIEHRRRWREQQEEDSRKAFFWGLVPAYTAVDNYGHRLPVNPPKVVPTAMKSWLESLSMDGFDPILREPAPISLMGDL